MLCFMQRGGTLIMISTINDKLLKVSEIIAEFGKNDIATEQRKQRKYFPGFIYFSFFLFLSQYITGKINVSSQAVYKGEYDDRKKVYIKDYPCSIFLPVYSIFRIRVLLFNVAYRVAIVLLGDGTRNNSGDRVAKAIECSFIIRISEAN
ncbi:hypothetical protein TNCT_310681 [Trichonephila clavata]|uniref:Uncharacterized protein n=1 Tax=Trichonephila clavata TaxID=2740835 RepID=A0A8X6FLU9_TRICU|nr:hypothetical protein TNCT_310681 [Trichonephila clavata]